jgi:uncharacterized protein (DUF885 family)
MMRLVALAALGAALICAGCGRKAADPVAFQNLTREFVYSTLAASPVSATAAGYHTHNGVLLDEKLDDYSKAGIDAHRQWLADWTKRLKALDATQLDAESTADLELMNGQIEADQLEFESIQSWRHNPTVYVELVGNALFTPFSVEYAPSAERWRHIIARLKGVPALAEAARANLVDSNAIWTRVATEENDGTIGLIEKAFPARLPAEFKADYEAAAAPAVAALKGLSEHIKTLPDRGPDGWRLGRALYAKKFRLAVGDGGTPAQLLADAESELLKVRKRMFMLSVPLHVKYYPTHRDPVDLNLIVGETLDKVAQEHSTREAYFDDTRKTLDETRAFLKTHEAEIVKLPGQDNLKLIETPPFMRGIYGVGGFSPAPALQPQLGAFYWLTPIPEAWPKERVESKLREYNRYGLQILTIHEALPGHYVQFEYANRIQPEPRRLLRAVFGSGTYVEGWAVYATELMVEQGYMDKDPEFELTWLKQELRAIANTILDIRMQTMGMTDDEALKLMTERTFQEREEATAKLQRAKLGSCQLPTYYAGFRAWRALSQSVRERDGARFHAGEFHARALAAGALPMPTLGRLLGVAAK